MKKISKTCLVLPGGPGLSEWVYKKYLPQMDELQYVFFEQKTGLSLEEHKQELIRLVELTAAESEQVYVLAHSSGGCVLSKALGEIEEMISAGIFLSSPSHAGVDTDFLQWQKTPDFKILEELSILNRNHSVDFGSTPLSQSARKENVLANQFFDNWKMFFDENNKQVAEEFISKTHFTPEIALSFYEKDFPQYNLEEDLATFKNVHRNCFYLYPENDQRITPNHIYSLKSHSKIHLRVIPGGHFCFVDKHDEFKQALMGILNNFSG